MTQRPHQLVLLLTAVLLVCGLAGCGTINEKLSAGMGDYVPQWAGGLPPDAPPRPGTPQYEAWMKERERLRLLPADQRDKPATASATGSTPSATGSTSSTTSTPSAGLNPVY